VLLTLFAAILIGVAVAQLATFVTTVYLHRALSHRAITMHPILAFTFRVLLWITVAIRPREWVAVHRKHHAFTDVAGDPHSPVLEGFAMVQFGNVALYRKVAKDEEVVARYARDLPADRWDRVLFDHALVGLSIGIGILCLTFGWRVGLLAAGIHTVTYLLMNAAINAIGHSFGSQPHTNTSFNNQWLAWLTSGEGLHNNHHAAPTSAKLALAPGEIDPAWWVIRFLQKRGWATIRHAGVHLKQKQAA
jgi:stearoyl-CoA desaturase (delta-9 desaturase)